MDIKNVLYNTVKELPVTLGGISFKAKFDKFITEKKNEIMNQEKTKGNDIFSICNGILLYGDWVVIPAVLKKDLERFSYRTSRNIKNESSYDEIHLLEWHGQGN